MDNATSYVKTFALNLKPMYDQSSFKQVIAKVKDGFEKIETLPVKFDDEKIAKDLKEAVEKARSEVDDSTLQLLNASTTLTDEQKQAAYEAYDKQTEALFKIKKLKDEIAAQEMFGNEDYEILNNETKEVFARYDTFCHENGFTKVAMQTFSKEITRHLDCKIADKKIKGRKCRIFVRKDD